MPSRFHPLRFRPCDPALAWALARLPLAPVGLALVVAALAPAPLRADGVLEVVGVSDPIRSGTLLSFQVQVRGGSPGAKITVRAWIGAEEIKDFTQAQNGAGGLTVTLPIPEGAAHQTLAVQAQCGQAAPAWVRVAVLPGEAPRTEAKEEKQAAAPGLGWSLRLPDALKAKVAEYAGAKTLGATDRAFAKAASRAARNLVIGQDMDIASLAHLLQTYSGVRSITVKVWLKLSAEGIAQALRPCKDLKALDIRFGGKPSADVLRRIIREHANLVSLKTDCPFSADMLATLPATMAKLDLYGSELKDADFHRFTQLRELRVSGSRAFSGHGLPADLETLKVDRCPAFTGTGLPGSLASLGVHGCEGFTGTGLPGSLASLEVGECGHFQGAGVLPGLVSLKLQGCFGLTAEAARVTVHGAPGLVDLAIEAAVTPDLVRDLPASLVSLRLAGVSMGRVVAVGDRPFAGLANLKTLWMAYVEDFTGDGLPASLQNLTVNGCMRFRSTGLNSVPLEALTVMKACPNFDGQGLPASLRRLSLTESYAGEETVYRMIGPLTRLERLDYSRFDGHSGKPDLTRFQGHPALRELHWSRNRFQRQDDGAWR